MSSRILTQDVAVAMPDGTRLATDVTVADDGAAHPTLLIRTPYGRGRARADYDHVALARLGWAVVVQDVRGRWDSDGQFRPFLAERADGAATVAWCRTQPWSNGAVAMAGASYVGMTQWLAAAERPAGLRAITPTVTVPDIPGEAVFADGVFSQGTFTAWALGIGAIGSTLDSGLVERARQELDQWPTLLGHSLNESVIAELTPDGTRWLEPQHQELWGPLDISPQLPELDIAAYHLAGWHDLFCEGNLRAYAAMTASDVPESLRRKQRLVIGPWAHGSVLRRVTGELDFGLAADGQVNGIPEEQVAFLGQAVASADVPSGVRVFIMGANRWLDLDGWPPRTEETVLYLAADGRLTSAPAEVSGSDRFTHDPADPVPSTGGRTLHPIPPGAGPLDQRAVESRPDVLVYTSDVLAHDVTVLGTVRAEVGFESSANRADVLIKLVDVHPDGRAMLVVDGIQRVDLTPGEPTKVAVRVGSTGITFPAGHRIRVEVASSNYPRFDTCPKAHQTVHHGGRSGSSISLPTFVLG